MPAFESSLDERRSSLANSSFYLLVTGLLSYLQKTMSDSSHADTGRAAAAKYVYDRLTSEISQLVMDKLETGDDAVVSRLGTFLLCLSGKSNVQADAQSTQKMVRFVGSGSDEVASSQVGESSAAIATDDGNLTATDDKTRGSLTGSDLMGDDRSPLWLLMCESCRLSLRFVHSELSCRHLRFLSVVLSANVAERLLAGLVTQPELSSTSDMSACQDFLERMLLPLVDRFHSSEGSQYMLSLLTSVHGRLQPAEQVPVLKEIADRAVWSVVCADFLSELVSSAELGEEVQCWLHGSEFGKFVVSLTDSICRRCQLTESQRDEVDDITAENNSSVDDSHWKLLCACLATNHKSGSSCLNLCICSVVT